MEQLLTADDLCVRLGMHPDQIYYHARLGHLPCVRIGRNVRFVWSQIEEWLADGGSPCITDSIVETDVVEVPND